MLTLVVHQIPIFTNALANEARLSSSNTTVKKQGQNDPTFGVMSNDFAAGSGTIVDPYLIATAEQLNKVRNHLNAHFKLIANIDLSTYSSGNGWKPIGSSTQEFKGTFDGNGFKITNLRINSLTDANIGLFSQTSNSAIIKNVTLEGVNVRGGNFTSALVGSNKGTIENSSVNGSVTGGWAVGPITAMNTGTIRFSFAKGTANGDNNVGGLVGQNYNGGDIINCYAITNVTVKNSGIGGLVGENMSNYNSPSSTVTNSYSAGKVSGSKDAGGLVGINNNSNVSTSYYDRETSLQNDLGKGFGKSTIDMKKKATFSSWNFTDIWYIDEGNSYPRLQWELNPPKDYPNLSISLETTGTKLTLDPITITITNAKDVSNNKLNGSFHVTINSNKNGTVYNQPVSFNNGNASLQITLYDPGKHQLTVKVNTVYVEKKMEVDVTAKFAGGNGSENNPFLIANAEQLHRVREHLNGHFRLIGNIDLSSYSSGSGWTPIGSATTPFKGSFDGSGYKISKLKMNTSNNYVGLFGEVASNAVIKNVLLEDVDIKGTNDVGGIAGKSHGTIMNSIVSGQLNGQNRVGGLAGSHSGTISNSYATVELSASNYVGGLIGWNESSGTISHSYSASKVNGDNYLGGLVGNLSGTVNHSYYDKDLAKRNDASKGEPKTTQEMKQLKTYAEWDFENVWYIWENNTYPQLRWEKDTWDNHSSFAVNLLDPTKNIVAHEPFQIEITEAKGKFGNLLNGNISVTVTSDKENNEVFADKVSFVDGNVTFPITLTEMGTHQLNVHVEGITNSQKIEALVKVNVVVTVESNEANSGAVTGGGTFLNDSTVTLTATPKQGYRFVNWTMDNDVISDKAEFNYTVPNHDVTITANFAKDSYALTVLPNDTNAGEVVGSGSYEFESDVTIKATPKDGYRFINCTIGNDVISDKAEFTYTIPSHDVTITANFAKKSYALTVLANDENAGEVEGSGSYEFESDVTIEATPKNGYRFINWTIDDVEVSTEANFNYVMPASNITIIANFEKIISGGGSSGNENKSDGSIDVPVKLNQEVLVQLKIMRTTNANGQIADELTFTQALGNELANKLKQLNVSHVHIFIPDENDEVAETNIILEKEALTALANVSSNIQFVMKNGTITLPLESLGNVNEDIRFRITPIKDEQAKKDVENRAKNEQVVEQVANGVNVQVIARPLKVETNIKQRTVILTLPLDDVKLAKENKELYIYIEHSDGEKELIEPTIMESSNGEYYLQFTVDKFSLFTILLMDRTNEENLHNAYIKGYQNGTFRPDAPITRAEMAALLARLFDEEDGQKRANAPFADVSHHHWAHEAISFVHERKLMIGKAHEQFKPDDSITRAEMVVIVARYLKLPLLSDEESELAFSDITKHWAVKEIAAVKEVGIVGGYVDGTFRPDEKLTRAQAVTILNRLLNRGPLYDMASQSFSDVPPSHWAFHEIEEAAQDHHYIIREEGGEKIIIVEMP